MADEKFYEFLLAALRNMAAHIAEGSSANIFHADTEGLNFRRAFKEAGFHISGVCIWMKNSLVLEHKICHGGRPVLRWNMDNAYVRTDPAGNLKLDKEKSTEKVDGAVALVMALDRAMKNLNAGDSVYNHRGLLVL